MPARYDPEVSGPGYVMINGTTSMKTDQAEAYAKSILDAVFESRIQENWFQIEITAYDGGTSVDWATAKRFLSPYQALETIAKGAEEQLQFVQAECFRYNKDGDKLERQWILKID